MMHIYAIAGLVLALAGVRSAGAATNEAPRFQEVYDLVREHLKGFSEADLNRAAVEGFLSQLQGRVALAGVGDASPAAAARTGGVTRVTVYDGHFALLRLGAISKGSGAALKENYQGLAGSNDLRGVVLDLRYADGADYGAAVEVADLFLSTAQTLLDWGEGPTRSTAKKDAVKGPVMVLVNRQTARAAEALAAVLRQREIALLLGATTAGKGSVAKEFALQNGQRLSIATAAVKLGDGEALPPQGLKPDIEVRVSAEDEAAWFADPFRAARSGSTALARGDLPGGAAATNAARRRINEAELVRMQREGVRPDDEEPAQGRPPELYRQTLNDPALARAVDLLKALSLVQPSRSP